MCTRTQTRARVWHTKYTNTRITTSQEDTQDITVFTLHEEVRKWMEVNGGRWWGRERYYLCLLTYWERKSRRIRWLSSPKRVLCMWWDVVRSLYARRRVKVQQRKNIFQIDGMWYLRKWGKWFGARGISATTIEWIMPDFLEQMLSFTNIALYALVECFRLSFSSH